MSNAALQRYFHAVEKLVKAGNDASIRNRVFFIYKTYVDNGAKELIRVLLEKNSRKWLQYGKISSRAE